MIVYLNGRFVPEDQAVISINDRGFLYGDGVFEAVRIYDGQPFLWSEHMSRFSLGASALEIHPPLPIQEMLSILRELLHRNGLRQAIARLTLTRGSGPRGYSARGANHPTLVIALYPAPEHLAEAFHVVISRHRLPSHDLLAGFKHCNKLIQVAARLEADAKGADEALLLNDQGHVVEGTSTNLFWVKGDTICTPPLDEGILAGTTRQHVFQIAQAHGIPTLEESIDPGQLEKVDGLFLTSCAIEVMEVATVNRKPLKRSPLVARLKSIYKVPG